MAVALVSLFVPMSMMAQVWSVTIDEYGNGLYASNGVTTPFSGELLQDPSGGLAGSVLVYTLPFNFQQTGDYYLTNSFEPIPQFPPLTNSDVVRFWGINQIIFYSDTNDIDDVAKADTGLPATLISPNVGLLETGVEGGYQDATHQALNGDPGFAGLVGVTGAQGITYIFISDVPEPGSLAMLAGGLAGLAWFVRRRRGK